MKKLMKPLALAMALCLVLSLGAFASGDPSAQPAADGSFARVDDTHWAGDSVTIRSVEIAGEYADYVDATQFCNISKIVYDGGEIDVDYANYTAILTVDGIQVDLYNAADAVFEGDVVLTLIEKGESANSGNAKFGDDAGSLIGAHYYSAAAYFDDEGYQPAKSVEAAQYGAYVDDGVVFDMEFASVGDYFSGVYVNDADVTVADSSFVAVGKGGDDFTGQGAMVVASGEAQVTIQDSVFVTQGALRSAIWAGGSSNVEVIDTVVQTYNDEDLVPYTTEDNFATPMMQQVPFALGLTGNIRATLDCGQAAISFRDSLIASNGWAVLSTDSGSGTLVATDTVAVLGYVSEAVRGGKYDETYTVDGIEYGINYGRVGKDSGYIAYCDGFTDYAYGGRWFAPDYLAIITGGTFSIDASENGRFYGWSDRIGFMSHQTNANTTLSFARSDFDITDTFAVVKSKGGNAETINLDDVTVNLTGSNPWGGNLLEVIDSDDLGGGPGATTFTVPYGTYDEYLAAANNGDGGMTTLNIANSTLTGNIYDSVGSQTGSQTAFRTDSILVNLTNATLNGAVSSAYAVHADGEGNALLGTITVDSYGRDGTYDYLTIGRLLNFPAPTVNNPVYVSLTNSVWNVTGLSYVAYLSVGEGSAVNGTVYKDGQAVAAAPGTVLQDVVIVPVGYDLNQTVAYAAAAIQAAADNGVVPADRSELVANVDMGSSGEASGEAS